ncbi:MAG: hypothetical protein IT559_05635 [Alphaproteobacteria bacterium]|nr:hypothetical protein [Alphaproteobacteria bacterium]
MQKLFLNIFVKALLPFMTAAPAFATGEPASVPQSTEPATTIPFMPDMPLQLPKALPLLSIEEVPLSDHPAEMAGHAAAAGHDVGHAATSGLPQMDPTWFPSQIFWLALTFLALYFVFARKILPNLSSTIENRRSQIQGDLDSAQHLKEEAASVRNAYETILNEAREKCTELFIKVDEDIKKKTGKKMDSFSLRATKETQKTEEAIEEATNAAMGDMNAIAAELASLAAEKVIGIKPDIDQAKTLVNSLGRKAA